MNKGRSIFVALLLIAILVGVTAVSAKAQGPTTVDAKVAKGATLKVTNRTGGTIYIRLSGPAGSYSFSTSSVKAKFTGIKPGRYVITVTASHCRGSLTYKRNLKGSASLPTFICG